MSARTNENVVYLFIIDTDTYTGNFERELCAYITGYAGECGVGQDIADKIEKDLEFNYLKYIDTHILLRPDEHGCHRPVSIWPTPGWVNDGMGNCRQGSEDGWPAYMSVAIFFVDEIPDNIATVMQSRAHEFERLIKAGEIENAGGVWLGNQSFCINGFRLVKQELVETVIKTY